MTYPDSLAGTLAAPASVLETTASRLRSVCYVVMSFPVPSETFVADEILSVKRRGIDVHLVRMLEGNSTIVHPVAQALLDAGQVSQLQESNRKQQLLALLQLTLRRPLGIWKTIARVLLSKERWTYFHTLPIASELAGQQIDYVHAHFVNGNLMMAAAIADWIGCPFGVTTHGSDIHREFIPRKSAISILGRASIVITVSHFNLGLVEQSFGVAPHTVNVVRCGIDLDRFRFVADREPATEGFRICSVGRLVPVKAQSDLLHAVALLVAGGTDCSLDLVGAGPLHDDLVSLASELGIAERVRFWGAQSSDTVISVVSRAHVFVLSSLSEGLPVACMESMALGTPVVATSITALPELIEHGESGLLVEPGRPDLLAKAIAQVLNCPEKAGRFALRGREKIEAEFSRERCTDELLQVLEKAVQAS